MEALTSPRDPKRAARDLAAAGYRGERVVLLQPEDFPTIKALTEVAADMLRQAGMNVDVQSVEALIGFRGGEVGTVAWG